MPRYPRPATLTAERPVYKFMVCFGPRLATRPDDLAKNVAAGHCPDNHYAGDIITPPVLYNIGGGKRALDISM